MKKCFLLISCFAWSAAVVQSQTQSGGSSVGAVPGAPQPGAVAPINPQPGLPATSGISNDAAGANRVSGVIPGETNRIPFGGTNQIRFGSTNQIQFGGTNTGRLINEPSGANQPGQIPFGGTNQPQFGATNQRTGLPTNNTPLAGSGTIQEPSGAANPNNPAGVAIPANGAAAADAAFSQQLKAALSRGGATRIFFPQTRSTVTLVNQNGTILLTGSVASEEERRNIEARVKNSAGVTSVNNQLQIANLQNRQLLPGQNPAPGTETNRQLLNP